MKLGSIIASKFRIDRVVGRGAMGIVVEAMDLTNGQRVAVKLILPHYAMDRQLRGRFIREANVMSRLRSEHVARVYDAGELDDGTLFLVMEYLEGQSLEDLVKSGGPLPVLDAVDLMLEALDAIGEAHELGLVHRDLKPSNLFLAARPGNAPILKVLDFGIVKDLADHSALTTRGTLPGTPAYMAPEQIALQSDLIDARADIWAIGVTLHEILTGALPFTGPMQTMLTRIRSEAAPRLRARRPDISPELEELVERCLAKRPEGRFSSGLELGEALADLRRRGLGRPPRAPVRTVRKGDPSYPRDLETAPDSVRGFPRGGEYSKPRGRGAGGWLMVLLCSSTVCVVIGILVATRSTPHEGEGAGAGPTTPLDAGPPVDSGALIAAVDGSVAGGMSEAPSSSFSAPSDLAPASASAFRRGPRHVRLVSAKNTGDRAWKAWLERHRSRIEACVSPQPCPAAVAIRLARSDGATTVTVEPGAPGRSCTLSPSVVDCLRELARDRVPPPDVCPPSEATECHGEVLLAIE